MLNGTQHVIKIDSTFKLLRDQQPWFFGYVIMGCIECLNSQPIQYN